MEIIPRIGFVLGLVEKELGEVLSPERVEAACRAAGHVWRRRKLGPAQAVYLMVLQVLHANTALAHLRRLAGVAAGASAICRAKARLPLAALRSLCTSVCRAAGAACSGAGAADSWRWHRHRVRGVDATAFTTPDTPALARAFGKSSGHNHKTGKKKRKKKAAAKAAARHTNKGRKPARGAGAAGKRAGSKRAGERQAARHRRRERRERMARRRPRNAGALGFPVVKALALFDLGAGVLLKLIPLPLHRQEMSVAVRLLSHLGFGDVLVADRAFCSFAWLALLLRVGVEAAVRLPQRQRVGTRGRGDGSRPHGTRRRLRRLGPNDWLVRWGKPLQRPGWISRVRWASLPDSVELRQVTYRVRRKGYRTRAVTLVTTLTDPAKYPAKDLADLYLRRWRVEGCFRSLKQELGMDELQAKTVAGVKKEMLAYAIAYNLVRLVTAKAARAQGVDPWRISFVDAVRWMLSARDGDELPELVVNPERPGRWEPRMVKRRPKGYWRLNKPREQVRQEMLAKKAAA